MKNKISKILSMVVPIGIGGWCFYVYLAELLRTIQNGNYQEWNVMTLIYAMVGLVFFFIAYRIAKGWLVPDIRGMLCWGVSAIILASGTIRQYWIADILSLALFFVGTHLVIVADPTVLDERKDENKEN